MRKLIAVAAIIAGLSSVGASLAEHHERQFRDFTFDHASALAFAHGRDPYAPVEEVVSRELPQFAVLGKGFLSQFPYWHPPIRVLVGLPFVGLSYPTASRLWVILMVIAFVSALYVFARSMNWSKTTAVTIAFGTLATPLVRAELGLGQTQGLVLLLIVLAWRALTRDGDMRAGVFLGIATALRLWPGFMLLALIGMRRKGAVKSMIITTAAGILVPAVLVGLSPGEFVHETIAGGGYSEWRTAAWNISLHAVIPWAPVAIIASLVLSFLAIRQASRIGREALLAGVPLMLLAWPISWAFYLIVAIPWIAAAIARASGVRRVIFVLIAFIASMNLPGLSPLSGTVLITALALIAGLWLEAATERSLLPTSSPRGGALGRVPADAQPEDDRFTL